MLEPKDLPLKGQDGVERVYIIHKFPALTGREVIAKYPLSSMPKLGDYAANQEAMLLLMSFVGVTVGDRVELLKTRALVDNHVPDWETLAKIEMAMIEYNCSFFANGGASRLVADLSRHSQQWITQTLTALLQQLSAKSSPPSQSLKPQSH